MNRHCYAVHGLTIASSFRVHSWGAASIADGSIPVEQSVPWLVLKTARGQQTSPPHGASAPTRRGGLAVSRGALGLCLRTVTGDLAWLSDCSKRHDQPQIASLQRAAGVSRVQFERVLCNVLLPNVLATQGHRMLHAAAVIVAGKAVLFCGDSGAGKSTLAAGFSTLGFDVLSDDVLRLARGSDGHWSAFPSYPGLHLRPETFLEVPAGAAARRGKQWVPLSVNHKPREGVPVAAMYGLARQLRVAPSISPMGGVSALEQWMRALFMDGVPRERRAPEAFDAALSLARHVPTFGLRYRRSPQHFGDLLKSIIDHAERL